MKVVVEVDSNKCNLCKLCVEYCPALVFTIRNSHLEVDSSKCVECYGCIPLCPQKAINVKFAKGGLYDFLN